MYTKYYLAILVFLCTVSVYAQNQKDSLQVVDIPEVIVSGTSSNRQQKKSALHIDVLQDEYLKKHFNGNIVQMLENVAGIQSMDIGMGFSKPMIRGLGFNRIAVSENGVKHEGQQWGADHGLEIDAFDVENVRVLKGPSSLSHGSDAMGGVIEILPPNMPVDNQFFGSASFLGKSVNESLGGSVMLGFKKDNFMLRARYSESHFGDYRIPTDTIIYLTQKIPVYGKKLKNTAGMERNASLFSMYRSGRYMSNYSFSNIYQKVGFFPGAHGIPDLSRIEDDGNSRNIDQPNSLVNHFKFTTLQQYTLKDIIFSANLGYQYNHREEWSQFHTHYGDQPVPAVHPDKELEFRLHLISGSFKANFLRSSKWENVVGIDFQKHLNNIGGYSFLLPKYDKFNMGAYWISNWHITDKLTLTGGIRYDWGKINISSYEDPYLQSYLSGQGYTESEIEDYRWRSYPVNKTFGDYSGSLGLVWMPDKHNIIKFNIGRSFRLPGANELASNGMHHGTFRHEKGDPSLNSERGWQTDALYSFKSGIVQLDISPFFNYFENYIYLKPTGQWSVLPHAGQVYQFTGASAILTGSEFNFSLDLTKNLSYRFGGEYLYTYNLDENTALSYSPPATFTNVLTWKTRIWQLDLECKNILAQNRVARNEDKTPGATLFNMNGFINIPIGKEYASLSFSINNIFNKKYYNHLSFYRKIEIPEPGRNFQLSLNIPFTIIK